jgi:hypothetical protein
MKTLFTNIVFNGYQNSFWTDTWHNASPDGKFYIDIARRLNPNRFISRCNATWTTPFDQDIWPGMEMPKYNKNFSKTFEDITDERSMDILNGIREGKKYAIMYSGGIDSTVIMCSLIKNLGVKQLKNIAVCTTSSAILNNPIFWKEYIIDKFKIINADENKYDNLIEQGYIPVTGDTGDALFGTTFASQLYYTWKQYTNNLSAKSITSIENKIKHVTDPNIHYSTFKDLLILYFSIPKRQGYPFTGVKLPVEGFSERFYEKLDLHAKTAPFEINSLHDFFWWYIFNIKYTNCAKRGIIFFNNNADIKTADDIVINWYHTNDYQLWSMSNNNNGEKIGLSAATYKQVSRDYIFDLDGNQSYYMFKLKIENIGLLVGRQNVSDVDLYTRPNARFGVDSNFKKLYIDHKDTRISIQEDLGNFIDGS